MDLLDKNYKPKAKTDIIVKNVDEEKVLFNPANSFIHVLNKTAYPVWKLADGTNTIETIIQKLSEMYKNSKENFNIEEDVLRVLTEFNNQDLLE